MSAWAFTVVTKQNNYWSFPQTEPICYLLRFVFRTELQFSKYAKNGECTITSHQIFLGPQKWILLNNLKKTLKNLFFFNQRTRGRKTRRQWPLVILKKPSRMSRHWFDQKRTPCQAMQNECSAALAIRYIFLKEKNKSTLNWSSAIYCYWWWPRNLDISQLFIVSQKYYLLNVLLIFVVYHIILPQLWHLMKKTRKHSNNGVILYDITSIDLIIQVNQ